jgi:hypothetical protein
MTTEEVFSDFNAKCATALSLAAAAPLTDSMRSIARARHAANASEGAAGAFFAVMVFIQMLDHLLLLAHITLEKYS